MRGEWVQVGLLKSEKRGWDWDWDWDWGSKIIIELVRLEIFFFFFIVFVMFVCYFIGKMDLMWPNRMNSIKCCFVHQQNFWYTQHVFKFPMIPLPYNFFFSFLLLILHSFLPNRRFVLVRGLP